MENDKFHLKVFIKDQLCTRRGILLVVNLFHDPLGMTAPFIHPAKILVQDLCRKGSGWSVEIPDSHTTHTRECLNDLAKISQVAIEKYVLKPVESSDIASCKIHNFCNACQVAYGAVSYLRLVDKQSQVYCLFLTGKSHLAPFKEITIPRLEVTAATVSVRKTRS